MRSLWPCLWEVLQKWSLLEVTNFSQRRFSGTLWRVHLHFAWLAQHFRLWCCMFFCESPCQGCVKWWQRATCVAGVGHCESVFLSGRCSIWWRSVVFAMWSCVSGAVFGTLYTLHSPLYTLHSTLDTLHLPLHTLHSALGTPHSTLYTCHSTLYTLHFTSRLYTLHSTLHTPQSQFHTLDTTFPTQHSTVFTLHTLRSTPFHFPQSTLVW